MTVLLGNKDQSTECRLKSDTNGVRTTHDWLRVDAASLEHKLQNSTLHGNAIAAARVAETKAKSSKKQKTNDVAHADICAAQDTLA